MDDLISRAAAIREYQEVCKGIKCGECPLLIKVNTEKGSHLITDCKLEAFLHDLPSAQPETHEERTETHGVCLDTISRRTAIDAVRKEIERVIKELPSAQPEPQWIPCSERLPEDLEEVNVTWVNHKPEPYYYFVKGKPFTASAVYYNGKWFWYTSTCADLLAEYGKNPNHEIDDAIEITAWMPLPEPYKERREE